MRVSLILIVEMTLSFAFVQHSTNDPILTEFVLNLSEIDGNIEVNLISDLSTTEVRGAHIYVHQNPTTQLISHSGCGENCPSWSAHFPIQNSTLEPTVGEMEDEKMSYL